jgi:excisionase family DNA binding protein
MFKDSLTTGEKAALRVDEAAQIFGVATRTVRHWIERGDLPCVRLGRTVLVPKAAVEMLLAAPLAGWPSGRFVT